MDDSTQSPPRRHAVLIVADGNFLEAFAERNIDVRFVRVPQAHSHFGLQVAEDCLELMLPKRYRDLWRRDLLRSTGSSHPLTAQAALNALAAKDSIAALEEFMPPKPKKGAA